METVKALKTAKERGFDLAEVSPKADPPVCRFVDYGKYKYQLLKKKQQQQKKSRKTKLKGVRLSTRISEHDFKLKMHTAERFLNRGDKVRVEIRLRGRENLHADLAFELLKKFIDNISVTCRLEQEPKKLGSVLFMIIQKQ